MKRECAVTILAQNAKQDTPLSHSKQVPCDKEAPRLVSRRPACGNGAHAPDATYAPAPHDPRLRPLAALAESRGAAEPKLVPARRVAARIGAGRVARLAKVLDIRCDERLAITNSGCNARVFHYVTHSYFC